MLAFTENQLTSFVWEMDAGNWACPLWQAFHSGDTFELLKVMDEVVEAKCRAIDLETCR